MKAALALRAGRAASPASTPSTTSSAKKPRPGPLRLAGALRRRALVKNDILLLSPSQMIPAGAYESSLAGVSARPPCGGRMLASGDRAPRPSGRNEGRGDARAMG